MGASLANGATAIRSHLDVEALEKKVNALLAEDCSDTAHELTVLSRAHEMLHEALS